MKNINRVLWGLLLVAVGVLFGLKAMDLIEFEIFFDGWWSLILIIPSLIALITQRDKTGSMIGLVIGVFLLLVARDIISWQMLAKLIIPVLMVVVGLCLIFKDVVNRHAKEAIKRINSRGFHRHKNSAMFSSQKVAYSGEGFFGAELYSVFGSLDCDLRGSVITEDIVVSAYSLFGSMDIYVPENVNVEICATPVFGGISNRTKRPFTNGLPTVFVTGAAVFGGVDVL